MRRPVTATLAAAALLSLAVTSPPGSAEPAPVAHESVNMEQMSAREIYSPTSGEPYHKATAMIVGETDIGMWSCDQFQSGPGSAITYRKSRVDGTWPAAATVLEPTWEGADSAGVCHPSVVELGGYYYVAYSGTRQAAGNENDIFVARSTSRLGPFLKWNGTYWGRQSPQPVARHMDGGYGAWAPSLVVRDGLLYLYYTATMPTQQQRNASQTGTFAQVFLKVADVSGRSGPGDTWPERLDSMGRAIDLPGEVLPDGTGAGAAPDVKYASEYGFLALSAAAPYSDQAYPQLFTSKDGRSFVQGVAARAAWQAGAGDVGLSGDASGWLLGPEVPRFATYSVATAPSPTSSSTWLGPVRSSYPGPVGAVTSAQGNDPASWLTVSGDWSAVDGAYTSTYVPDTLAVAELKSRVPASATIEVDVKYVTTVSQNTRFSLAIGTSSSGASKFPCYLLYVFPDGTVMLARSADNQIEELTSVRTGLDTKANSQHLRIVRSGATIAVYYGAQAKVPQLVYTDSTPKPVTGGGLQLMTKGGTVAFAGLSVSDNVPSTGYVTEDWQAASGAWTRSGNSFVQKDPSGGQVNLRDTSQGNIVLDNRFWSAGDGTYRASVQLDPTQPSTSWGGLNLTNQSFRHPGWNEADNASGYLVFLRGNGNLGVYKRGAGQVVADVPTGTNPTVRPVQLRVVKTGRNLQVYVDGRSTAYVNYTDTSLDPQLLGVFGIATLGIATFSDIGYAADGSWR